MKKFNKYLWVFFLVLAELWLVSPNRAFAQYGINFVDGQPGSQGPPSQAHSTSGTLKVPCNPDSASVGFSANLNFVTSDSYTSLIFSMTFTNDNAFAVNLVACGMANFARPNVDSKIHPVGDTVEDVLVVANDAYVLHKRPAGDSCQYFCVEESKPRVESDAWSYYFGCKEMHIPANSSASIQGIYPTGPNGFPYAYALGDTAFKYPKLIELSMDPPSTDLNDTTVKTWNFVNLYVDVVPDCSIAASCNGTLSSPNTEVYPAAADAVGDTAPAIGNPKCAINTWKTINRIYKGPGPGGGSSITVQDGNWLTKSHDSYYHARFYGTLANAPAGTKLVGVCPVDTNSDGKPIIDSGFIYTDTASGCTSDTLGFTFPFLITPEYGYMQWELKLPLNSCSNFGNGRRIQLHGEVYADSALSPYAKDEFMYAVQGTFVFDTTPPVASNFTLTPIDSTHLLVKLKGTDDTTTVNMGYIRYSINGSSYTSRALQFQKDSLVGHTTYFRDTLISPVGHAHIMIKGYVVNEVGLIDSTSLDSAQLPVAAPASVNNSATEDCKLENIQIDRTQNAITLKLETMGGPLLITLIDELGREWQITPSAYLALGEQIITRSLPKLPQGAYFLRLQTGTCVVTKKIIL